ncbi:MAG: DUF4375 domain-containing protein [Pseudomonadota bacterium]
MRAAGVALAALLTSAPVAASDDPCKPGARLIYPLTEVIAQRGVALDVRPMIDLSGTVNLFSDDGARAARDVVMTELASVSQIEKDIGLLALLDRKTLSTIPLAGVTVLASSVYMDDFRDVLTRHVAQTELDLLDRARAIFRPWGTSVSARYAQWSDGKGKTDPVTDLPLREVSAAWRERADPLGLAVEIARSDPKVFAVLDAERLAASDDARLRYLEAELSHCTRPWWKPHEADAVFGEIPEPQRDLIILSIFIAESMNGSTHQFFYNSAGTLAPQLAETLDRLGLPEHAAAIRQGMAMYPAPYPRDTEQRRAVMGGLTEADDEEFYALTAWAEDGAIYDAMIARAKETGLWPE